MKKNLRAGILIAFAVFIALTLGAARMAHVFSNRALRAGGTLESLTIPPSTSYTMQVLHRLGFSWNQTSREYVDMVFSMLRSLGYLRAN